MLPRMMLKMRIENHAIWSIRFLLFLITVSLCWTVASGQSTDAAAWNGNYKIGPGDVIDVIVSKNEILSRSGLRVSNLGTVQLAMMDTEMQAACLTEKQLADRVKEEYRKYMVEPFVNVAVKEFNSSPVAVIGAVNSPGRFQMQRSIQLAELLTYVNGVSDKAGRTVEILRDSGRPRCDGPRLFIPEAGEDELISVDIVSAFRGDGSANPVILPGDIVRVSDNSQLTAYIQGNVAASIAIVLREPVTITQAIAMAGGPSSGAQLDKVTIRRQIPGTVNREEMLTNVKEIIQGKRDDILIQPYDIIEVPGPKGAKKFFGELYKTLVPSLVQLPLRTIPVY